MLMLCIHFISDVPTYCYLSALLKMGKFFPSLPPSLQLWIKKQHLFFVASSPLTGDGHVNVSPKGVEGTFHIVGGLFGEIVGEGDNGEGERLPTSLKEEEEGYDGKDCCRRVWYEDLSGSGASESLFVD
jgi:hypothetical protein